MGTTKLMITIFEATLEFFTYFCFFKYILHVSVTDSRLRKVISLLLIPTWIFLYYYTLFPPAFISITIIFLLFTEKWYFTLCWTFVHTLLLSIISTSIFYLFCIFTGEIKEDSYDIPSVIITLSLIYAAFFLLAKKIPAEKKLFRRLGWRGYCLISFVIIVDFFLSSVSGLLLVININQRGRYLLILAILTLILMSILLLILYFRLQHYHTVLKERDAVNRNLLRLETEHYKELQEKNRDLRAFRHDYNAHITALRGLSAAQDLNGLKEYVDTLTDIKEQVYYVMTNQPVADAVISYFYEKMPKDAQFQTNGKFPDNFFLSDTDLCIILSNLLKNVVEALWRLPDEAEKKIYLSLHAYTEYATILIENTSEPYPEGTLSLLPTTKPGTSRHGFGLKNVQEVVDRYDGKLDLRYQDGTFTAYVYLHRF